MKRTVVFLAGIGVLVCLGFAAGRVTAHHDAAKNRRVLYYVDPMHPSYRSDKPGIAPDCGMALEPVFEGDTPAAAIAAGAGRLAISLDRQHLIGVRVAIASRTSVAESIRTTGRVVPEDDRLYRIQAGFEGWVDSVKDTPPGTVVKKDQVLAVLYGPEIRSVVVNYLGFISGVERVKQGMSPGDSKSFDDSKRLNEEHLRLIGMGQKQIEEIESTRRSISSIDLAAPASGVILSRNAAPYQRFDKGAELYRLADLSKVWIVADVHGYEGALRPGQRVKVDVPELRKSLMATVSSSLPLFDENSRTLKVRLEAENPGMVLRPDMFVDVELDDKRPEGISVPADAVIDSGRRKVVYVEVSDDVFEPREVEIAGEFGELAIVSKGVREGERVVIAGNFLLDSESRMRSGTNEISAAEMTQEGPKMRVSARGSAPGSELRDPVCGMLLKPAEVAFRESLGGKTYSLCSESCRRKFLADPERYTAVKAALVGGGEGRGRPR